MRSCHGTPGSTPLRGLVIRAHERARGETDARRPTATERARGRARDLPARDATWPNPPRSEHDARARDRPGELPVGRCEAPRRHTVTSPADRCPPLAALRACSSGDTFRSAPASVCYARSCAGASVRAPRTPSLTDRDMSSSPTTTTQSTGSRSSGSWRTTPTPPTTRERPSSISARTRGTSELTPSHTARAS